MTTHPNETPDTVTYEVRLYEATTWATGERRGGIVRTYHVEEAATILGGMRAIDAACAMARGDVLDELHTPEITPNPSLLGWPLGDARKAGE